MNDIKNFFINYAGAIIGAVIAIIILCTHVYEIVLWIIFIALGIFVGNYIQYNKSAVKENLHKFIDRL